MKNSIFVFLFSSISFFVHAQEKPGLTVEMATSVTYSGISLAPELHAVYARHNLYAGPRFNLNNSILPNNLVTGINTGYRYILLDKGKVFANTCLIYENLNMGKVAAKGSYIHEIYGALGAGWRFHEDKLALMAALGMGGYIERFKDQQTNKFTTQRNTGGWLRVSVSYRLF